MKSLHLVQRQEWQNKRLGCAALLYGSRELSLVSLPAMQFVRLIVLARPGAYRDVYFYFYQLFAVCLFYMFCLRFVGKWWSTCSRITILAVLELSFSREIGVSDLCRFYQVQSKDVFEDVDNVGLCVGHNGCSLFGK